jgi:predicted enzyme related to lactoylglutathione lyase
MGAPDNPPSDERVESTKVPVMTQPLLRKVDAVTFRVPDLETAVSFYVDRLGHPLRWRHDDIGQAAVALRDSDTEIVLTTRHGYEPNWLVDSADDAAKAIEAAGGRVLSPPVDIPVGRVAVVADPFGNVLVLVDLSKGRYATDEHGTVTAVVDDA